MTRRSYRLIAIVALAGVASGCATFSDNDLAAKVGTAQLSHDELSDRLAEAEGSGTAGERVDGALARSEIDKFVLRAVAEQVGLFNRYSAADGSLAVSCFHALQVVDRTQADDVVARLTSGEPWEDVAESVAPGAAAGSRVPCAPTAQILPEIPAVGELLGRLDPDGPAQVLDLTDQAVVFVIRPQPVGEVDVVEFLSAANAADPTLIDLVQAEAADGDVYVDPRFGEFDPEQFSVIPLG